MADPKPDLQKKGKAVILNVDDKEAGRYAVTRTLIKAGYEVLEAASGEEALKVVFEKYPDLVLLDVNLPDLDGFAVCKKIKADRRTASIPVVHLSATFVQSRHRIEGLEGGADGYLVQPVEPQELIASIRAFLRLRRVEQDLIESEDKYRMAAEVTGQAIYDHDLSSGVTEWSGPVENITGYTAREWSGKSYNEIGVLFHPEDRPSIIEKKKSLARDHGPYKAEYRLYKKDGSMIYVEDQGDFLYDENGKAVRVIGSLKDISERKEKEKRLIESLNQMSAFFEEVNVGMNILDEKMRYLEVNRLAARYIGFPREQILGRTPYEVAPAFAAEIVESFKRVLETGQAERNIEVKGSLPGSEEEIFWLSAHVPLTLPDGKPGIGVAAIDITDRKRAEEKLRQSESSLRLLTDNMLDLVSQMDAEGVFQYVSPSHRDILGYEPQELLGNSFFDFVHPDDFEVLMVKGTETKSNRYRNRANFRFRHKQGHYLWMEIYVNSVAGAGGEVVGIVACSREITERKRAEDKMADTMVMYRKALEGIIHSMGVAVEKRDQYTAGHQVRVAKLARAIAQEMGLEQDTIDGLTLAAEIHDIGKLSVPAEMLTKPGDFSDLELLMIKNHSRAGYDILKDIEFPWPIAQIIDQHHERIDGSGYPEGLKGADILLEARIIGVADVVEAMGSHRPYRASLGIEEALGEISRNRGKLYDPEIVDACLKLFREKQFELD